MDQRHAAPDAFRLRSLVSGIFERFCQRLVCFDVTEFFTRRIDIAVAHEIFLAELYRVHRQFLRDQIHLAFIGKDPLRIAGRAHVAAGNLVRVDHVLFDECVRNLIWPGA